MTSPELFRAYLETDYCVFDADEPLRIGERSVWLAAEYRRLKLQSAAFITAFNPYSARAGDQENQVAQAQLRAEIERCGGTIMAGEGRARAGGWPPEPSLLAIGLSFDDAATLARAFRQNAIVYAASDAIPALVWLGA